MLCLLLVPFNTCLGCPVMHTDSAFSTWLLVSLQRSDEQLCLAHCILSRLQEIRRSMSDGSATGGLLDAESLKKVRSAVRDIIAAKKKKQGDASTAAADKKQQSVTSPYLPSAHVSSALQYRVPCLDRCTFCAGSCGRVFADGAGASERRGLRHWLWRRTRASLGSNQMQS